MPLYDYKCEDCEHTFYKNLSIPERNTPINEPCPECQKDNTIKRAWGGGTSIVSGVSLKDKRSDYFRDRIESIKKRYPGNTIK